MGNARQDLRERLRSLGLRATTARLAVLALLRDAAGPLTHDAVQAKLGEGAPDTATLYRVLADLTARGLLRRMDLGDHVWRFELVDDRRDVTPDHPHFLCDGCGVVACLPPLQLTPTLGALPALLHGAQLHLRVSGRCATCAAPA
jgi:Fur family ferric uptake transcriptional regulator